MANSQILMQPLVVSTAATANVNQPISSETDGSLRARLVEYLRDDQFPIFDKALAKGRKLHKMMLADSATAGQMFTPPQASAESSLQTVESLKYFDYIEDLTAPNEQSLTMLKIGIVLETLGMDPCFARPPPSDDNEPSRVEPELEACFGDNIAITHEHILENWGPEDSSIPPSVACFQQVINPVEGIILAYDNVSPTAAAAESARKDAIIPDLKHWSDVAFLQWKSRASEDSELKYVLRYHVINYSSNDVVEAVQFANGNQTREWPGITYDGASEEGQALLGTPNGSSVAYLLIQHKEFLGHKTVEKITVFHNINRLELMLLFHIADVEVQTNNVEVCST